MTQITSFGVVGVQFRFEPLTPPEYMTTVCPASPLKEVFQSVSRQGRKKIIFNAIFSSL
jgi:hypothetical protein